MVAPWGIGVVSYCERGSHSKPVQLFPDKIREEGKRHLKFSFSLKKENLPAPKFIFVRGPANGRKSLPYSSMKKIQVSLPQILTLILPHKDVYR